MELVTIITTVVGSLALLILASAIVRRFRNRSRYQPDLDLAYRIVAVDNHGHHHEAKQGVAQCAADALPRSPALMPRIRPSRSAESYCVAFTVVVGDQTVVIDEISIPVDSLWTATRILRDVSFMIHPSGYADGNPTLGPSLVSLLGYLS